MRANTVVLRFPHVDRRATNTPRVEMKRRTTDSIAGLVMRLWIVAWGLLLMALVALGMVGARAGLRSSTVPVTRSAPDFSIDAEPSGLFSQHDAHVHHVP